MNRLNILLSNGDLVDKTGTNTANIPHAGREIELSSRVDHGVRIAIDVV
jgi:hypothetical protein